MLTYECKQCNIAWHADQHQLKILTPYYSAVFSGVSRISARGVLKLRGPVRKARGGGGGAVGFWPGTKGGGGGGGGGGLAQYKRVSRMCWRRVLKSLRARNFWQPRPFLRRRGVPEPPEAPPP